MKQIFGHTATGEAIEQIMLKNDDLSVKVLTLGGIIQSVTWAGSAQSMVLGYDTPDPYLTNPGKLGAIVGRYANRIGGARAVIAGRPYTFDPNFKGRHTLHGGSETLATQMFVCVESTPVSAHLRHIMPDGHMGFPGNLTVDVVYTLDGATLRMSIIATTDAPTLCNITGHSYFNLTGDDDISAHRLVVHASQILDVDDDQIPTGAYFDVSGTQFDLMSPNLLSLGAAIRDIDHNYCISHDQIDLRPVATLSAGSTSMTLATTEAGLQVYTGKGLGAPLPSAPNGRALRPYAGVALEPQFYPNSPNTPQFASAILMQHDTYRHVTEYRFLRNTHADDL